MGAGARAEGARRAAREHRVGDAGCRRCGPRRRAHAVLHGRLRSVAATRAAPPRSDAAAVGAHPPRPPRHRARARDPRAPRRRARASSRPPRGTRRSLARVGARPPTRTRTHLVRRETPRHALAMLSYAHGTSTTPLLGETVGENLRRTVARFGD